MNYFRAPVLLSLLLAFAASGIQAISQVTRSGRYLYTGGTRFYIKGVAYQNQGAVIASSSNSFGEPSTFVDPLATLSDCTRDLPYLQQLGVNTIRAYSVNSSLNHDGCMNLFSQAGIYTIIDLSLPSNGSIIRTSPSWSTNLLDEYITTINAFNKYDNVLAYNIGNEVIVDNTTNVAPYVKAAARDTKAYLHSIGSTALVGYAAIDGDSDFLFPVAEYLSCDPSNTNSNSTSIDIFGLNNYEWCGNSTYEASYASTNDEFAQYNVVAYFSEFGCLTSGPRVWTEVAALFGSEMTPVWSGGLAFSYFPAESAQGQFGMVTISANGSSVTTSTDFTNLQAQYAQVSFINSPAQSAAGAASYPSCPASTAEFVASTTLPPTPNDAACNCLEKELSCQFSPQSANYSGTVGTLLGTACGLIVTNGGNCSDISSNGTTGVYGSVSGCSPTIQLSYIMSQYYEDQGKKATACDFSGNALINPSAPSSLSATAAASSCISNPSATFAPTSPATAGAGSTSTGTSNKSGSASLVGNLDAIIGMSVLAIIGVMSAVWTLV